MKKLIALLFSVGLVGAAYAASDGSPVVIQDVVTGVSANTTVTDDLGGPVEVARWSRVAVFVGFKGTATNSGNVVLTFARTVDVNPYRNAGALFETASDLTATVALNGTNEVRAVVPLDPDKLHGVTGIRLLSIQNTAASANHITNLVVRVGRTDN